MNESRALIIDVHLRNEYYPVEPSNYTRRKNLVATSPQSHLALQHTTLGESVCDPVLRSYPSGCHSASDGDWFWRTWRQQLHPSPGTRTATSMTLTPSLRKFMRSAHITFTVGWLGSVAGFLALAITGLNSPDTQTARAAYIAMELMTRFVIVPLSLAPLLTGPILSLGTPWGLFRHYWILVKLLITVLSTLILLVHLQPISYLSRAAANATLSSADRAAQVQLVAASAAGLLALLVATALAVYKPRGLTSYGWRKQYEERRLSQP